MNKNYCNDGNHEFVGQDICIYCGEIKQILLQTKFYNSKPAKGLKEQQATSPEPCKKCKEKFEKDGVVPLYEATRSPKGPILGNRYVFMKREAIEGKEFIDFMNKHGFLVCEPELIDEIIKQQEKNNG